MLIKQTNKMTKSEQIAAENSNNQYLRALSAVAIGIIFPYAGTTVPGTFMLCDGAELDTTEYAELFAVIGYTFGGSGDVFKLPDLREKSLIGLDDVVCKYIIKTMKGIPVEIETLDKGAEYVFLGGDSKSTVEVELEIDDELSTTSKNPVQNQAVAKKLEKNRSEVLEELGKIKDYIVEQGTDGIWTYRKWNSGIAECWGYHRETVNCTEARNNIYTDGIKKIALPEKLFVSAPMANLNAVNATGWNFLIAHIYGVDTGNVSYIPASTGQMTAAVTAQFAISAKGRWK